MSRFALTFHGRLNVSRPACQPCGTDRDGGRGGGGGAGGGAAPRHGRHEIVDCTNNRKYASFITSVNVTSQRGRVYLTRSAGFMIAVDTVRRGVGRGGGERER